MKFDASRISDDKTKHYQSVLKQQGRVDVDADWNEQQAITLRRIESETVDVIGACGTPLHDSGFHIVTDPASLTEEEKLLAGNNNPPALQAGDFLISAGRYYVDGIQCENEQMVLFSAQPDLPPASPIVVETARIMATPVIGIIYLDVWHRLITALDDPMIREKALGGPDTATRLKTIWQVKVLPVTWEAATLPPCDTTFAGWDRLTAPGTGTLMARTLPPDPTEQPCLLPPSAGYQRLENQLYRVEIHEVDANGNPTFFKWSRDNGTVVTSIKSLGGNSIVVASVGPDDVLGFANGQWVEISDDGLELNGRPGYLVQIANVDEATCKITTTQPVPQVNLNANPKLRRWDQADDSATADGVAITPGWLALEDGIEVQFPGGTCKPGDYWLIPARTATGDIEWPVDAGGNPVAQLPLGIRHHYCRLALMQFKNDTLTIQDCRKIFPPLTELDIEECCAVSVNPKNWISVLNNLSSLNQSNISNKQPPLSVHVCFQVGEYLITDVPVSLEGFDSIKITGGGPGTRILAPVCEAVFVFTSCNSVEVSGIYGETGRSGFDKNTGQQNLRGVLTFYGCDAVTIDGVGLKGANWYAAPGVARAGSCICIQHLPVDKKTVPAVAPKPLSSVRIRHCDLTVGYFQVGMLVVNAQRVQIEDNKVMVNPTVVTWYPPRLLGNLQFRTRIRSLLFSTAALQPAAPVNKATGKGVKKVLLKTEAVAPGETVMANLVQAKVKIQNESLSFNTPQPLVNVWPDLIKANVVQRRPDEPLQSYMNRIADRVLLDPKIRRINPALGTWYKSTVASFLITLTPASQGIVVGGQFSTEVRIRDNTVSGAAQGIHVGFSHRDVHAKGTHHVKGTPDQALSVSIIGNAVTAYASPLLRDLEGIYVGNCDTLVIEGNRLVSRIDGKQGRGWVAISGIRIPGIPAKLAVIRHNHVTGFSQPVELPEPPAPQPTIVGNTTGSGENVFD